MDKPMPQAMTLDPDQADELHRLLGTVEDWLLHASFEVLDELGTFLTNLSFSRSATADTAAAQLITDLGDATVTLRPIITSQDGREPR
jgi:hypothetical protein